MHGRVGHGAFQCRAGLFQGVLGLEVRFQVPFGLLHFGREQGQFRLGYLQLGQPHVRRDPQRRPDGAGEIQPVLPPFRRRIGLCRTLRAFRSAGAGVSLPGRSKVEGKDRGAGCGHEKRREQSGREQSACVRPSGTAPGLGPPPGCRDETFDPRLHR